MKAEKSRVPPMANWATRPMTTRMMEMRRVIDFGLDVFKVSPKIST